jgi:hypothetical protein
MTPTCPTIHTACVNYYIKGNNAKIQFNYNWVNGNEVLKNRGLRL